MRKDQFILSLALGAVLIASSPASAFAATKPAVRAWARINRVNGSTSFTFNRSIKLKSKKTIQRPVTVSLAPNAAVSYRFSPAKTLDGFKPGDRVLVRGSWSNAQLSMITARSVQDVTYASTRPRVFVGNVLGTSNGAMTVATPRHGTVTVNIQTKTKLLNRRAKKMKVTPQSGDQVRILGILDKPNQTIIGTKEVKDLSVAK